MEKLLGWDEIMPGACLFAFGEEIKENVAQTPRDSRKYSDNNSHQAHVSDWRVTKPVFNSDHCINCQFCWVYCPDMSIISKDKKMVEVDYDHCKGCGICAEVCPTPVKSLMMVEEFKTIEDTLAVWPEKKKKEDK